MTDSRFPPLPADEARVVDLSLMDKIEVGCTLGNGFAVQVCMAPFSSDDLWETVKLPVRYPTKAQAEAKARQIRRAGKIDLRRWVWQPSAASPQGFMHRTPIATWIDAPFVPRPFDPMD